MKRADRCQPRAHGFTLIEVLAAVAILGIFVGVLAEVTFSGLRAEGDTVRRVQASLLADDRIQEIEAQAAAGSAPLGRRESQRDLFTITQELRPFDPEKDGLGPWLAALRPKSSAPPAPPLALLQAGPNAPLRIAHVEVRWNEGSSPRRVRRTTLVLDLGALKPFLAALANAQTPGAGGARGQAEAGRAGGVPAGGSQPQ